MKTGKLVDLSTTSIFNLKQRLGAQLTGLSNCPHCGISSPALLHCWQSQHALPRGDDGKPSVWAAYRCTTCGHVVSAKGAPGETVSNAVIVAIYPSAWQANDALPERASSYLSQARTTLASPDASVVMSASAIDAMLKDHGLRDGSLYSRIDQAVSNGTLTKGMAKWANRVRLDANSTRHADDNTPHMSIEDARRAFDFAEALGDFLYVLPSKMPPEQSEQQR